MIREAGLGAFGQQAHDPCAQRPVVKFSRDWAACVLGEALIRLERVSRELQEKAKTGEDALRLSKRANELRAWILGLKRDVEVADRKLFPERLRKKAWDAWVGPEPELRKLASALAAAHAPKAAPPAPRAAAEAPAVPATAPPLPESPAPWYRSPKILGFGAAALAVVGVGALALRRRSAPAVAGIDGAALGRVEFVRKQGDNLRGCYRGERQKGARQLDAQSLRLVVKQGGGSAVLVGCPQGEFDATAWTVRGGRRLRGRCAVGTRAHTVWKRVRAAACART